MKPRSIGSLRPAPPWPSLRPWRDLTRCLRPRTAMQPVRLIDS